MRGEVVLQSKLCGSWLQWLGPAAAQVCGCGCNALRAAQLPGV